jgi:hypothetical protein
MDGGFSAEDEMGKPAGKKSKDQPVDATKKLVLEIRAEMLDLYAAEQNLLHLVTTSQPVTADRAAVRQILAARTLYQLLGSPLVPNPFTVLTRLDLLVDRDVVPTRVNCLPVTEQHNRRLRLIEFAVERLLEVEPELLSEVPDTEPETERSMAIARCATIVERLAIVDDVSERRSLLKARRKAWATDPASGEYEDLFSYATGVHALAAVLAVVIYRLSEDNASIRPLRGRRGYVDALARELARELCLRDTAQGALRTRPPWMTPDPINGGGMISDPQVQDIQAVLDVAKPELGRKETVAQAWNPRRKARPTAMIDTAEQRVTHDLLFIDRGRGNPPTKNPPPELKNRHDLLDELQRMHRRGDQD